MTYFGGKGDDSFDEKHVVYLGSKTYPHSEYYSVHGEPLPSGVLKKQALLVLKALLDIEPTVLAGGDTVYIPPFEELLDVVVDVDAVNRLVDHFNNMIQHVGLPGRPMASVASPDEIMKRLQEMYTRLCIIQKTGGRHNCFCTQT